jgi:hypothetical protein
MELSENESRLVNSLVAGHRDQVVFSGIVEKPPTSKKKENKVQTRIIAVGKHKFYVFKPGAKVLLMFLS